MNFNYPKKYFISQIFKHSNRYREKFVVWKILFFVGELLSDNDVFLRY